MVVRVDERRHHGLAGQVDARRARGHAHVGRAADRRETVPCDDKGGVLDGSASVADDDARAFEDGDVVLRQHGERQRQDGGREDEKLRSVHGPSSAVNSITDR